MFFMHVFMGFCNLLLLVLSACSYFLTIFGYILTRECDFSLIWADTDRCGPSFSSNRRFWTQIRYFLNFPRFFGQPFGENTFSKNAPPTNLCMLLYFTVFYCIICDFIVFCVSIRPWLNRIIKKFAVRTRSSKPQ